MSVPAVFALHPCLSRIFDGGHKGIEVVCGFSESDLARIVNMSQLMVCGPVGIQKHTRVGQEQIGILIPHILVIFDVYVKAGCVPGGIDALCPGETVPLGVYPPQHGGTGHIVLVGGVVRIKAHIFCIVLNHHLVPKLHKVLGPAVCPRGAVFVFIFLLFLKAGQGAQSACGQNYPVRNQFADVVFAFSGLHIRIDNRFLDLFAVAFELVHKRSPVVAGLGVLRIISVHGVFGASREAHHRCKFLLTGEGGVIEIYQLAAVHTRAVYGVVSVFQFYAVPASEPGIRPGPIGGGKDNARSGALLVIAGIYADYFPGPCIIAAHIVLSAYHIGAANSGKLLVPLAPLAEGDGLVDIVVARLTHNGKGRLQIGRKYPRDIVCLTFLRQGFHRVRIYAVGQRGAGVVKKQVPHILFQFFPRCGILFAFRFPKAELGGIEIYT